MSPDLFILRAYMTSTARRLEPSSLPCLKPKVIQAFQRQLYNGFLYGKSDGASTQRRIGQRHRDFLKAAEATQADYSLSPTGYVRR